MIYFVCIGVLCFSAFIGKQLTGVLVKRAEFFAKMNEFCGYLRSNIAFFHKKLADIFDGFISDFYSKYNDVFYEFKKYVDVGDKNEIKIDKLFFLKSDEKNTIINFLLELGKSDEKNQILLIDNFGSYINKKSEECNLKRKTNEGLIYKVSLAVGAVVCILIL